MAQGDQVCGHQVGVTLTGLSMVRVSRYANTDQIGDLLEHRAHALQKTPACPFRPLAKLM
jgi:hypothetical protein